MVVDPCVSGRASGARHRLSTLICAAAVAVTTCASLGQRPALAAEVDAAGAVAPANFADIIERVRPAVVGVRVKSEERTPSSEAQPASPFPPGSPLDRFLRQFGITPDPAPRAGGSLGSGFFLTGDGYIVTNNHVIAGARAIEVTTDEGKVHPAKLVGTDAQTDLALIKIDTQVDLPYVRLAATEPRIGEWVVAIGNPFGFGGTVTAGIVSARGRDIGEGPYSDFIQIDAPVNEGNSGGPSFNVKGEVIGVNAAIYAPSGGGSIGVAFAIPAATVKTIAQQLKEKGRVTRGWIGVEMQPVTPAIAEALGLKKPQGALIAQVDAEGPAAKHGIGSGDVITSIDERDVKDPREVARIIAGIMPDTLVKFGMFQNGQEKSVMVRLGELPRVTPAKAVDSIENAALGLTLAPARSVSPGWEKGVVVMDINPEGVAADSGLLIGDVILHVEGQATNSPADVGRIVNEARAQSKRAIMLRFRRGEMAGFVAIPFE